MRLSDSLKAKRAEILDRMTAVSELAEREARLLTADEARDFDTLKRELDALDKQLATQIAAEDLRRSGGGVRLLDERGEALTVLRGGPQMDRLADRRGSSYAADLRAEFSPGALIRGIVVNDWRGRPALQRALSEGVLAAGGYTVPAPLSAAWLDLARAASACSAAGAIVVPMESQTLRIAGLASDIVPGFRDELTDFPISNNTFRALDLRARSIGCISEASIELIADSPNIDEMVQTSMIGAMGVAFDAALLAGDGVTAGALDNPIGIINWPGIGATAAVGTPADYKPWTAGMAAIAGLNFTPATVIDTPHTSYFLGDLATGIAGDRTSLQPPAAYAAAQKLMTTSMPDGSSLIGDFTKSGWGMRESIVIEASRVSGDSLQKGKVQIRIASRLDTFVTHAGAFHKLTGVTYV